MRLVSSINIIIGEVNRMGNYNNYNNNQVAGVNDLTPFIRQLSPGTRVRVQYDCQPPATGIFQGFQNGLVLLDNFNGFPGLTRLLPRKINAIAPFTAGRHHDDDDDYDSED